MTYCIATKAWPCSADHPRAALPRRAAHRRNSHMLKGRTAVITGSTSGIGLGIARALAGEGANVVLNGFGDAAEIEKTRSAVESEFGIKAAYSPADMTKAAEIAAMIKTAAQTFGSVDILVNNAGIQHVAPIEEFPIEKWDQIIGNCISPGYVWTPLVEKQIPDQMKSRNMTAEEVKRDVLLAAQPTKQFVTIEQVAALALYLCSDAAASVTGANLSIDGGWSAQ